VLASGDTTKKITVGTLSREYILHVPSAYKGTSATPLVIDFHPIGGSDTSWRAGSPYPALVDKEGVITVYPNGQPSPNLGNAWNVEGFVVRGPAVVRSRRGFASRSLCELARRTRLARPPSFA